MSSSIVTVGSLNPAKLSVSPIKTLESGAKSAYVNYDGGKLVMQTPNEISLPYGLNKFDQGPKADNPDYSIDISFKGYDSDGPIKSYYDSLAAFDKFIMSEAYKNRVAWFRDNTLTESEIRRFYTPSIKFAKDKEGNVKPYPPTQKIKMRKNGDSFDATLYEPSGKKINESAIDVLVKGVSVTVLVECGGLWFAGGKFGVTWRAKQIVIHNTPERLGDFAFVGLGGGAGGGEGPRASQAHVSNVIDDEHEAALMAAVVPPMPAPEPIPAPADDDEEPEEVEPIKKPIAKKKVVVGKPKA